MLFNSYIWSLYKNSEQGQKAISRYTSITSDTIESELGLGEYVWPLADEGKLYWG